MNQEAQKQNRLWLDVKNAKELERKIHLIND